MGMKLTSLRDFYSTPTAKRLSLPHGPGGKSGRRACHPVVARIPATTAPRGAARPCGQGRGPAGRVCRQLGGQEGRRERGGARREGKAWPRPHAGGRERLAAPRGGRARGRGLLLSSSDLSPGPGPALCPVLITRDARRHQPCSAACRRRLPPGKASPSHSPA